MANRRIDSKGYVLIPVANGHPDARRNGMALEHRVVWREHHGPIPDQCVIHHENGDRTDNRIANLKCMSRSEHALEHFDEVESALEKHRHKGTEAMVRQNQEDGPWNAGTAEIWEIDCAVCGTSFERKAAEVRKNKRRGRRNVCGKSCKAELMKRARRNKDAKAKGEEVSP